MILLLHNKNTFYGLLILVPWLIVQSLFSQYADIDEVSIVASDETSTIVAVGYGYGNLGPYVVHGKIWVFYSDGTNAYWRTKLINPDNEWSERRFLFQETQGAYFNVAFDGTYFHFVRQVSDNEGWGELEYRRGKAEKDGSITLNGGEIIYADSTWRVSNRHFSVYSDSHGNLWAMVKVRNVSNDRYKSVVLSSTGANGEWKDRPGFPKNLNNETSSDINGRGPKIIEIDNGKILFSWRNHGGEYYGIWARVWIENDNVPDGEGTLGDLENTMITSSLAKSGETSIVSPEHGIAMINSGRTVARRNADGTWERVDPPAGIIEDDILRSNSLSVNGNNVRIWDVDGNNIRYSESTDYGSNWSNIVVRTSAQAPGHLSASHAEGSEGSFHGALWRTGDNPYDIGMSIDGVVNTELIEPPSVPLLVFPKDEETDIEINPVLIWETSDGADSYTVQVSTNSDMAAPEVNDSGIPDTVYQVSLEYETTYYWRVRATNEGGTSDWSPVESFTTVVAVPGKPVLISPANGSIDIDINPVLSWEKVEQANEYTIQISQSSDISNPAINTSGITGTEYHASLSTETTYYWRVRATNEGGDGGWSEVWNFTTAPAAPDVPMLVSPDDGAENIVADTQLKWETSARADNYHLQMSKNSDFTILIVDSSSIKETSFILANDLESYTTYYWRVRAINTGGKSNWSSVWSFTTTDVSSVERIAGGIPYEFTVEQNYPNPFNPVTIIRFGLPSEVNVRLDIYNMLGQRVATIIDDKHYTPGIYEAVWDARDAAGNEVSSGVYIYRISAGDYVEIKKMILTR